jgi:MFS family permease
MTAAARAERNVRLYFAYRFFANFGLWAPIWIKYLIIDRGLELKWILAMDLPFWLLVAALQAPTGALADRIGRKPVLVAAGVLYAATILGFGFTTNYWLLFADYVLWALATSLMTGADQALVYDSLKEAGQEHRFKQILGRAFAATLFAGVVSESLGGYVATWTSLAFAVQISALAPLMAAGVALAMHEPAIVRQAGRYWRQLGDALAFSWSEPRVRYTILVGSLVLTAGFGPVVLVQPFLIDRDVPTHLFGVYQAPLRLTSVVGALVAYRVVRRAGTFRLVPAGCTGIVAAYLALAFVPSNGAFAFFGVSSLMTGLMRPAIEGHLNDIIPSANRATVLSTMQLAFALQVAFFEPALGFLADDVSLTVAFAFSAGLFAVTMPPLLLLWRRAGPAPGEKAPVPVAAGAAHGQ